MRVVVTGAANPTGAAIVQALLAKGHQVRLFGVDATVAAQFDGQGTVEWHPGDLRVGGSIEPVLSEREVLIHAACLDAPGADKQVHANMIEMGTRYARYGAEREQVDHFIHIHPAEGGRFGESQRIAAAFAQGARGTMNVKVMQDDGPEATAKAVLQALEEGGRMGKQPGRENDAVTA